jgi:tRNA-Thr(GGU) m(6)t(6)A37 methyltransferase TsaA
MPTAPEEMTLKVIAHIHTAFPTKFGIPRQSGLVDELRGEVIFTPEYRNADAVRGLEDFSHIWLVWQFSGAVRDSWSPTVRPPRLGGNTRMGVFATRSPFRPNPLGLSSVRLEGIEHRPDVGPVLIVRGADLMDGTPIYDIKPYIPYADCHPDAAEGFTGQTQFHRLQVQFPPDLLAQVPQADRAALTGVLAGDPRPSYQHDPQRVYGMEFGPVEVHFTVDGEVLTVTGIARR